MENTPWVSCSIERGPVHGDLKNRVGLRLTVQARPELEQFMQQLADGHTSPLDAYTEEWVGIPKGSAPDVYRVEFGYDSTKYTLNTVGGPLLLDNGGGGLDAPQPARAGARIAAAPHREPPEQIVNLSFLTLTGISREEGITIGINGAFSFDYIQNVRNRIPTAIKQFLHDFVVPVTINLQIVQRM